MRLAILGKASPWEIFANLIDGRPHGMLLCSKIFPYPLSPIINHAYEEDYRYGSCRFCGEHHGFLLLPGSGAPPLTPLPKFNDLNQPAVDVAPVVMKSKK